MIEPLTFSNVVMRVGKLVLVSGCLLGITVGCGSRLQKTVMSGSEPVSTSKVAQGEPVTAQPEETVQTVIQEEKIASASPLDIPVEEPAHPVIRPSVPREIFATPRTGDSEPVVPGSPEAPLIADLEPPQPPVAATVPSQIFPQEFPKESLAEPGKPPISFEPEVPAFPTIRGEVAPTEETRAEVVPQPIQEPASPPLPLLEEKSLDLIEQDSKSHEPMQRAKVVPSAPETVESRTEDLLKALGDVYFDYDRFTIRKDAIPVLKENAQTLVADLSDKQIVIEGHCDERGTESYNMVLGERRASAVKEFLIDLGVQGDRLQVVSFGKEKPFCTDQNEQCLQENRRGHFVLR